MDGAWQYQCPATLCLYAPASGVAPHKQRPRSSASQHHSHASTAGGEERPSIDLPSRCDGSLADSSMRWAPAGAVGARRARPCSRHNSEPGQLAGTLHNPVAQPSEWPTGHASVDPESTHYPRPALRSVWLPASRGVWMTVTAAGPQGGLAGRLGGAPAPAPRHTRDLRPRVASRQ